MRKWIIAILIVLFSFLPNVVSAKEDKITLYLFYGDGCPHCAEEKVFLESIREKYKNLHIEMYETWYNTENDEFMRAVKKVFQIDKPGVPFTVIGEDSYLGYYSAASEYIEELITSYDGKKARDIVSEVKTALEEGIDLPELTVNQVQENVNTQITLPFLGNVNLKELSLPIVSIVLGALDGFNPCAMWILLFLITMLMNTKDKKKMWILGLTFILTSGIVYLFFMLAWLKVAVTANQTMILRNLVAIIAIACAFFQLCSFIKSSKNGGCTVTNHDRQKKIMERIKNIVTEKHLFLAMFGIMALAFIVNLIELACSAGIPLLFTQMLAMNHLSPFASAFYIFLYLLFFLMDDFIVFMIFMVTMKVTGFSTKYARYSHLIGGILLLIIGLLLIFKPGILMFSF